ncbi:NAD(P)/FAD-dependent oxidoreductase [Paenibacillus sp. P96]|uniref:NAD(P)/FAD-dependent oxidoreductase n=1 Tax=Paenibacillus zeirhizosphaerae TaxID=2987519 RepID=A0ABT9FUL8_9BACL|nr:NAD(P)/FAD-dependent oxidoreductase [Paenibacillus sp. P96]MDP4098433.1 NAD(P)/FAD-dependent oxidoreductase [Paenibacillus sp. P96]
MKKFVILGGGYGGLTIVNELLDKSIPRDTELVLVDRMPFQGLKTEYYSLAAGTVSDFELRVTFPEHDQLTRRFGEVTSIDLDARIIHFKEGDPLLYDQLVIGLGCTDRFHNTPGAEEFSCTIQSFNSTRRTYMRLNEINPYGSVHIVGGGLSGVEIAAELRESRPDLNISIMDRGERVLSSFPQRLSAYVHEWFKEHDVNALSRVSVTRVEPNAIYNHDDLIQTDAVVWTAGIQPVKVVQDLSIAKDPQGRIVVNELYQIPNHTEVYVVGDCASLPFSPSAQAAGIQGEQIAHIVQAIWKGEKPQTHAIKLRGTLGSLGKKAGFGYGFLGGTALRGRIPRLLKSGVLWKSKRHFG